MSATRIAVSAVAAIAALFFATSAAAAEEVAAAKRIPAIRTVPHELDVLVTAGHVQGAACSTQGIYIAHQRGIVKLSWQGRRIGDVTAPPHLGDIAFRDGRIYGAFALRDGDSRRDGTPGMVRVWDENLNVVAEKKYPENLDGIALLGDTVFAGVDRWGKRPHPLCCVKRLGLDLEDKGDTDVDLGYKISYGVQTMESIGTNLVFGTYPGCAIVPQDLSGAKAVEFECNIGFGRVPESISGRKTPVFFAVRQLGGGVKAWRHDPIGNPPQLQFEFYEYRDGGFVDITERPANGE